MGPAMEELINKTQLPRKIIPTSSRWLSDSTKESHFSSSIAIILLPRTKVRNHHRYQPHGTKIARGEFIIKENQYKNQITTINKKTLTNIISLHKHSLVQHTLTHKETNRHTHTDKETNTNTHTHTGIVTQNSSYT